MKTKLQLISAIILLALTTFGARSLAQDFSAEALARRTLERRAVEAAIWGMPIVAFDAMRQAFLRDVGAKYNDIVYWSKQADWKLQVTTPNASSWYVYIAINTQDGPVVLDLPPAVGAGLFGSMNDAWQIPQADVGPAGEDQGKGGKYLMLPPGYTEAVPAGYLPIRFNTYNGYSILRSIPATTSDADVAKALDLVRKTRVYALAQAANPPPQRHIDMAGKLFDGIARFGDSFYDSLARMVNDEPMQSRSIYRLMVKVVPVDGFWSISVYNAEGHFVKNAFDAYALHNITAKKHTDGSVAVQFGGCDGKIVNCLPTMPGWNYLVRLYRPRAEILNGTWTFPEAQPVL